MFDLHELDRFILPSTPISLDPNTNYPNHSNHSNPTSKISPPETHHSTLSLSTSTSSSPQTPISARAQNLALQYHDFAQTKPQIPLPAEDGHTYFDCPKVWEKIVMHPRFDDVDVEALCAELNAKVKIVPPPRRPPPRVSSLCLGVSDGC